MYTLSISVSSDHYAHQDLSFILIGNLNVGGKYQKCIRLLSNLSRKPTDRRGAGDLTISLIPEWLL
jgi:hypothetical protein